MNIKSIEPTPSPNSMKINIDQRLPDGQRYNYTKDNMEQAPDEIKKILMVAGVKSIYHVSDFLAVERNSRFDWRQILRDIRAIFGDESGKENVQKNVERMDAYGDIKVQVQYFKQIPMQVKVIDGQEEKRFGLPEKFKKAAMEAATTENIVMERKWIDEGIRYGTLDEVGEQVVEELLAAYPDERLEQIFQVAKHSSVEAMEKQPRAKKKITQELLDDPDWKKRYEALAQMDPEESDIPVLAKALQDEKSSIRRLAVVYLGMIESEQVLPYLERAVLHDSSVTVRRTAGDCLSDLGNPKAIPTMMKALQDKNKLVRWRAAMFLYEVGDKTALPALYEAEHDPEFEVAMQVKLAIQRIAEGKEAQGSVWKQMTESRIKK